MKRFLILLVLTAFIINPVWAQPAGIQPVDPAAPPEMVTVLEKITGDVSTELASLRLANQQSADALGKTGVYKDAATAILDAKLANVTYGHSSLIISPEGMVTAASPSRYIGLVGTDLSYQPEVQYANSKKHPVISGVFLMEEGFYGISVSYPIFSRDNQYLGYTDITIRPEEFFRNIAVPITEQTGYEVFIIQKDGLTIYETNEEETGTNVLTDPLYDTPEMQNVSRAVIDNQSGTIQYTFWNQYWNKQVPREAVWTTLTTDDQEWRIGVVRNRDESDRAPAAVSTSEKPLDLNASISDMTKFVTDAALYAANVGQKEACTAFNNLSGPYVSDSRYIFAYDMDGNALALPYQQGLIGKNRMNLTDINGLAIMPAMIDMAQEGGGYQYFVYPNPVDDFANQLKIFYIEPVDSEWFVASGVFLPWIPAEIDQNEIASLVARVKNAASHADKVGKEQAIRDFNDLNGTYADGGAYIFAYDYDGTTLALPHQPDLLGENRSDFTDIYGSPVIALEVDAAQRGGGFVYVVYYNPDTARNELKLCYILPAADDWLVGSGIYTGEGLEK